MKSLTKHLGLIFSILLASNVAAQEVAEEPYYFFRTQMEVLDGGPYFVPMPVTNIQTLESKQFIVTSSTPSVAYPFPAAYYSRLEYNGTGETEIYATVGDNSAKMVLKYIDNQKPYFVLVNKKSKLLLGDTLELGFYSSYNMAIETVEKKFSSLNPNVIDLMSENKQMQKASSYSAFSYYGLKFVTKKSGIAAIACNIGGHLDTAFVEVTNFKHPNWGKDTVKIVPVDTTVYGKVFPRDQTMYVGDTLVFYVNVEKGKKANTGDGFPVIYPNVLHEYLEMVEYKQILTEDNMFYKKTIVGYKALKPGKLKMGYYFNGRIDSTDLTILPSKIPFDTSTFSKLLPSFSTLVLGSDGVIINTNKTNPKIEYSLSNSNLILDTYIDGNLRLHANDFGLCNLYAKVKGTNEVLQTVAIEVIPYIFSDDFKFKKGSLTLCKGQSENLSIGWGETYKSLKIKIGYSSSNPSVAVVDSLGTIKAINKGVAVIKAEGARNETIGFIRVVEDSAELKTKFFNVSPKNVKIEIGDTVRFFAGFNQKQTDTLYRPTYKLLENKAVAIAGEPYTPYLVNEGATTKCVGGLIRAHALGKAAMVCYFFGMPDTAFIEVVNPLVKRDTIVSNVDVKKVEMIDLQTLLVRFTQPLVLKPGTSISDYLTVKVINTDSLKSKSLKISELKTIELSADGMTLKVTFSRNLNATDKVALALTEGTVYTQQNNTALHFDMVVSVDKASVVETFESNGLLVAYPNPTSGEVSIRYAAGIDLVEVYNINGLLLFSKSCANSPKVQLSLGSTNTDMVIVSKLQLVIKK